MVFGFSIEKEHLAPMTDPAAGTEDQALLDRFDAAATQFAHARRVLGAVIFGQDEVIDMTLTTLAAGGHGLLVGAPGLAKTLLVASLAQALGLDDKRIQFTPDLMPGDILGSEVLEESADGKRAFRFIKGPIFCQLLMADEINRASPRTQSALLQAMQENHVTVAGGRYDLPAPFQVMATQNPIEQEGTYPLPEAQLDRFIMQINVDYPDFDAERAMLASTTGIDGQQIKAAMTASDLLDAQRLVREMPIGEQVVDVILKLVRALRPNEEANEHVRNFVTWGPGPRASQSFALAARALALVDGRHAPSLDDVARLAKPILRHRMALNFNARAEGIDTDQFIEEIASSII